MTAAELSPHALVINSFSKYFCMTGWRVGWMVVPEPLVRPIERLQQNLAISVPTLSQIAAEAAFDGRDEMEAVKRGYQENRRILIEGLPQGRARPNSCRPTARSISMPTSRDFTADSFDFAKRMLAEAHVAATPGRRFRSDPRPQLHPLLLCALGRGDARGGRAHRALARQGQAARLMLRCAACIARLRRYSANSIRRILVSARSSLRLRSPSAHLALAAMLWPQRCRAACRAHCAASVLVALGTALLTLSAKINLPLPYVPMTLQTLVVLMIGAAYGWRARRCDHASPIWRRARSGCRCSPVRSAAWRR